MLSSRVCASGRALVGKCNTAGRALLRPTGFLVICCRCTCGQMPSCLGSPLLPYEECRPCLPLIVSAFLVVRGSNIHVVFPSMLYKFIGRGT